MLDGHNTLHVHLDCTIRVMYKGKCIASMVILINSVQSSEQLERQTAHWRGKKNTADEIWPVEFLSGEYEAGRVVVKQGFYSFRSLVTGPKDF